MDEIDFEERDWVPYSGWPFPKAHLDPFYERAQAVCQSGPYDYGIETWEERQKSPRIPVDGDRVKTVIFQFGARDPFVGAYRDEIDRAENVTTFLHTNVAEIETTQNARAVTKLRAVSLDGKRFWITAKLFILAAGAIETPRLLLLSNETMRAGLATNTTWSAGSSWSIPISGREVHAERLRDHRLDSALPDSPGEGGNGHGQACNCRGSSQERKDSELLRLPLSSFRGCEEEHHSRLASRFLALVSGAPRCTGQPDITPPTTQGLM